MLPVDAITDGWDLLIVLAVVVVGWAYFLLSTAVLIWAERRIVARMQSRLGPNRLGPWGILQTLADGAKFFFKEDILPKGVDKPVYFAAPLVSAIIAMVTFAVIPIGGDFALAGRDISLQIWDPEIGMLWPLATGSLAVYGIVLAGWSSGSKYPLLGGVRSSAQMISYELSMGLAVGAVFIYTGSLRVSDIVAAQQGSLITDSIPILNLIPAWHLVPMFPAFVLFFIAATAEIQRPPFDLPEAEGELVGGFNTEYSAAKFAMFFLAEFMNVITMSAIIVTMFLGGPSGPVPAGDGWLATTAQIVLPIVYFTAKVWVFVFIYIWMRGSLPRFRYDRLMTLGWKVMLPLGIAWVFLTGFAVVIRSWARTVDDPLPTLGTWAAIIIGVAVLLYLVSPLFASREDAEVEPAAGSGGSGGGGGGSPVRTDPGTAPGGSQVTEPGRADDAHDLPDDDADVDTSRPAGVT
ncbi:NADH-quinone oxidoreductase subunit H [Euzebya sp.]|uniref:complex I subunit 1/NuoH family protein n=1 Tax=Euzebya sp. TaxID=1971409 RepID=UPI0035152F15